jgi:hypothetical protein
MPGYKYCQAPGQGGIKTIFSAAGCPKSMALLNDLKSTPNLDVIDCGAYPDSCLWKDTWNDTDVSPSTDPSVINIGNNVPSVLCNNDDLIVGYCQTSPNI